MNRLKIVVPLLLAALMLIVSGCSAGKSPKEDIVSALTKMQDLKSYSFKGELGFDELTLPESMSAEDAQAAAMVSSLLKGATVTFRGNAQTKPMRTELTMDMKLGGDGMSFNLSFPMIVTEEKMWIKIPQIPMFPMPEELTGKFVEIDMKKLAEQQGQDLKSLDTAATQQMVQEMTKTLMDNFDEKTYFSEVKAADVKGLPEELKDEKLIRFAITPDNFDQAITTIVDKVAPQLIDSLLKNESYLTALGLTKEDLESAKKELEGTEDGEIKQGIDEIKKSLKINELSVTGAVKDDYLVYQSLIANVDVTNEGETMKFGLHFDTSYDQINEDVKFEYELPTDAVPMEELESLFGGAPAL
ncbi:hypothetical protein [Paenibacillus xanthanilyticus]|uniref:Lipoprotein n=1 Tax=Paenibacillus xanthanilyticus TaxID=1783531 RepID=A0ABV8JX25_9BACL